MAEVDHTLASWIIGSLPYLLAALALLWLLTKKGADLSHRWFAFFMKLLCRIAKPNPKAEELKKDFFSGLASITSHDPNLRKQNRIRILEVGVGSGFNFPYYPEGTHLMVVDPNPHFSKTYNENRKKFPNIHSEEIYVTKGEEMTGVADNSVDVVVMTRVLCCVSDVEKILKQTLRVLVPGGKFYFMEHIREFDAEKHWMRSALQNILTITGIWPLLFDGCCLNCEFLPSIEVAGFSNVDARTFYAPINHIIFQIIKPHLRGVATK